MAVGVPRDQRRSGVRHGPHRRVISAFSLYNEGILALILRTSGTVLVFWIAHVYAEIVGNRDSGWRLAVKEALQRSAGLLWALIVPLLSLATAAALRTSENTAVDIALWACVGTLALLGWWAARQRHAQLPGKILTATGTATLGLALITLKAFVH